MNEINYLFLFFKISVFFGMMWSLSIFVPSISKGIQVDKKPLTCIIKENIYLTLVNLFLFIAVLCLAFL